MMGYGTAFDLVAVNERGGGVRSRRRRDSAAPYSPFREFGLKDMHGNSSIAAANRARAESQARERAAEQAADDGLKWSDLSERERSNRARLELYSSTEQRNILRNAEREQEIQRRDDARQAVRDYVREQEEQGRDWNGDGKWDHADAEAARRNWRNDNTLFGDGEDSEISQGDESSASTADRAAQADNPEIAGTGKELTIAVVEALIDSKIANHLESAPHEECSYGT